jgi:hypothetical protein
MFTFEQSTGKWFDPSGQHIATGYAGGNCGKNPEGINNPAMQNVACIGPLPCGIYTKGTLVPESHLGRDAIQLIPDPNNEMFGRSDFYCHGDTVKPHCASEGCITLPHDIRMAFYNSDETQLQVVKEYNANP